MGSTNRNITDANIWLVSSPQLKCILLAIWHYQMNHPTRVFLERQRLQPDEVFLLRHIHVHQPVLPPVRSENVRIGLFAYFTFELFPRVRDNASIFFFVHFLFKPVLEAFVVDEADWSITFARIEERVLWSLLVGPADFTLNFVFCGIYNSTIYFYCFFRKIISSYPIIVIMNSSKLIRLFDRRTPCLSMVIICGTDSVSPKILNFKFNSSKFNNVPLFKTIVLYFRWINSFYTLRRSRLKVSNNNEHLVVYILIQLLAFVFTQLLKIVSNCVIFHKKLS